MKPPRVKLPPTLEIDEADPFAWLRFIAGSIWAGDRRKMDRALATYSSELLAILRDVAEQPAAPVTMETLGNRLGIAPAELTRMPGSAAFYTSFFTQSREATQSVFQNVFEPSGHFRTVAEAPGSQQLVLDYGKALQGGAFYAGLLLIIVAMLAQRHPELPPSLRRAIAVLEGWSARGLMQLPSDRTLISAWKNWRHVAPLWAAYAGEFQDARASNLSSFAAGLEALQDPVRLGRLLGHAKWFRTFGTSFIPEHATAPLIPPGDAVEIIAKAAEEMPPLAPLPPADVEVVRNYRAPTNKFFG